MPSIQLTVSFDAGATRLEHKASVVEAAQAGFAVVWGLPPGGAPRLTFLGLRQHLQAQLADSLGCLLLCVQGLEGSFLRVFPGRWEMVGTGHPSLCHPGTSEAVGLSVRAESPRESDTTGPAPPGRPTPSEGTGLLANCIM